MLHVQHAFDVTREAKVALGCRLVRLLLMLSNFPSASIAHQRTHASHELLNIPKFQTIYRVLELSLKTYTHSKLRILVLDQTAKNTVWCSGC